MNSVTCTCTLSTLSRTKRLRLSIVSHSKDPYEDVMSSRVSKRLTKYVTGQIAKKISGELPSGFIGKDFCCHVRENVWWLHRLHRDIVATGDLQGLCTFAIEGNLQVHALRRNINAVTMPMCDVLLRHFSKTMLYTKSIPVAYSYLLYTLDAIIYSVAYGPNYLVVRIAPGDYIFLLCEKPRSVCTRTRSDLGTVFRPYMCNSPLVAHMSLKISTNVTG